MPDQMIPVGYMHKRVEPRPDGLDAPNVRDIFSVRNCISGDICDDTNFWRHNGYWLFDSPNDMEDLAAEVPIPLEGLVLFFFRLHPSQWVREIDDWDAFSPEESFETRVVQPARSKL